MAQDKRLLSDGVSYRLLSDGTSKRDLSTASAVFGGVSIVIGGGIVASLLLLFLGR